MSGALMPATKTRNLNPNDFDAVLPGGETWSDYEGNTLYDDFDPGSGSTMGSYQPGTWQSIGGSDDYLHGDMIGTLRMTTIGSGPSAGTPGLPRVFTAFGEKITGPQDRNGYAGAWGYQTNDATGSGAGTGSGGAVGIGFDFLHVGARYYDPSSGRFLQRDQIGILGGTNVYAYVLSKPTIGVDPEGEFIFIAIVGGISLGVKALTEYYNYKSASDAAYAAQPYNDGSNESTQRDLESRRRALRKATTYMKCVIAHTPGTSLTGEPSPPTDVPSGIVDIINGSVGAAGG